MSGTFYANGVWQSMAALFAVRNICLGNALCESRLRRANEVRKDQGGD
jgi:hypothetical protein